MTFWAMIQKKERSLETGTLHIEMLELVREI